MGDRRYARAPLPLHFPVEAQVPESMRHLELRTALFQILKLAFRDRAAIGSDQFVYWDPTDPSACLAPDTFVRLGAKHELFEVWKVWERGAPQVAVEIVSRSDGSDAAWGEKLARYRRLGVEELVRFDPEANDTPLRIWDNVSGDLIERRLDDPTRAESLLGGSWSVVDDGELGPSLRLTDALTGTFLPTPEELALARVRELELEVERLKSHRLSDE
jgi:Uma2 family endonuclease